MTALVAACAVALAVVPAWRGAAQAKPAPDVSALVASLKSPDPATRAKAACALRDLGGLASPAIDALAALLPDASPVDQQICGQRWRGDDTSSPGEFAATALASIGSRAYAVLERTLQHDIWIARRNAAWALGVLDDARAVPALIARLLDREPPVRKQSAWALGVIDDNRAGGPLIDVLRDAEAEVREMAAWSLGVLDEETAVAPLMSALRDDHAGVRQRAAWALGVIGNPRAVEPLLSALKDRDPEVRRQAAWAIGVLAK
jgi:HEAT repeat protein